MKFSLFSWFKRKADDPNPNTPPAEGFSPETAAEALQSDAEIANAIAGQLQAIVQDPANIDTLYGVDITPLTVDGITYNRDAAVRAIQADTASIGNIQAALVVWAKAQNALASQANYDALFMDKERKQAAVDKFSEDPSARQAWADALTQFVNTFYPKALAGAPKAEEPKTDDDKKLRAAVDEAFRKYVADLLKNEGQSIKGFEGLNPIQQQHIHEMFMMNLEMSGGKEYVAALDRAAGELKNIKDEASRQSALPQLSAGMFEQFRASLTNLVADITDLTKEDPNDAWNNIAAGVTNLSTSMDAAAKMEPNKIYYFSTGTDLGFTALGKDLFLRIWKQNPRNPSTVIQLFQDNVKRLGGTPPQMEGAKSNVMETINVDSLQNDMLILAQASAAQHIAKFHTSAEDLLTFLIKRNAGEYSDVNVFDVVRADGGDRNTNVLIAFKGMSGRQLLFPMSPELKSEKWTIAINPVEPMSANGQFMGAIGEKWIDMLMVDLANAKDQWGEGKIYYAIKQLLKSLVDPSMFDHLEKIDTKTLFEQHGKPQLDLLKQVMEQRKRLFSSAEAANTEPEGGSPKSEGGPSDAGTPAPKNIEKPAFYALNALLRHGAKTTTSPQDLLAAVFRKYKGTPVGDTINVDGIKQSTSGGKGEFWNFVVENVYFHNMPKLNFTSRVESDDALRSGAGMDQYPRVAPNAYLVFAEFTDNFGVPGYLLTVGTINPDAAELPQDAPIEVQDTPFNVDATALFPKIQREKLQAAIDNAQIPADAKAAEAELKAFDESQAAAKSKKRLPESEVIEQDIKYLLAKLNQSQISEESFDPEVQLAFIDFLENLGSTIDPQGMGPEGEMDVASGKLYNELRNAAYTGDRKSIALVYSKLKQLTDMIKANEIERFGLAKDQLPPLIRNINNKYLLDLIAGVQSGLANTPQGNKLMDYARLELALEEIERNAHKPKSEENDKHLERLKNLTSGVMKEYDIQKPRSKKERVGEEVGIDALLSELESSGDLEKEPGGQLVQREESEAESAQAKAEELKDKIDATHAEYGFAFRDIGEAQKMRRARKDLLTPEMIKSYADAYQQAPAPDKNAVQALTNLTQEMVKNEEMYPVVITSQKPTKRKEPAKPALEPGDPEYQGLPDPKTPKKKKNVSPNTSVNPLVPTGPAGIDTSRQPKKEKTMEELKADALSRGTSKTKLVDQAREDIQAWTSRLDQKAQEAISTADADVVESLRKEYATIQKLLKSKADQTIETVESELKAADTMDRSVDMRAIDFAKEELKKLFDRYYAEFDGTSIQSPEPKDTFWTDKHLGFVSHKATLSKLSNKKIR